MPNVTTSEAKPRLAFIFTSPMSVRFVEGQLAYFRERGFEVSLISSDGPELEMARQEGAAVHVVPMEREISPRKDLVSLWRLWRTLRKIRPTITNVGTPKAGLLGGIAAVLAGVPRRIYTLHGLRLETTRGWKKALLSTTERIACLCAHQVHCVSPSLRRLVVESGIVSAQKAVVVGPGTCGGIDLERFRGQLESAQVAKEVRRQLDLADNSLVIGFVGRFTRDKGIHDLYSAFESIGEKRQDVKLLLVGCFEDGDPVSTEVREWIEQDRRVIRTGFVSNVTPYYSVMDVCVLPTYREGFPGVPLEAQAAGVPVITTQATGAVDSVIDQKTGLVVGIGDTKALAAAIERLLEDAPLRRRMGAAGRAWVERTFSNSAVWEALAAAYNQLSSEGCRI